MQLLIILINIITISSYINNKHNNKVLLSLYKMKESNDNVYDLVLEYLTKQGYTETAQVLRNESPKKDSTTSQSSKLEQLLLETKVVLGNDLPLPPNIDNLDDFSKLRLETQLIAYNFSDSDPYGASVMPLYQTATFKQPGATDFGAYDYTRSGNPTRDALQQQIAQLEGVPGATAYCFSTGMAALSAVTRLVAAGEEVIVNDDSYGGTYRLMSKVATRQGIKVTYVNMAGKSGAANLQEAISPLTKLVMIESPTNPMQRICDVREIAKVCRANKHPTGTLLSIDNTMMSPILSRPLEIGADIVIHSATKFMCGHSDTMAGAVILRDMKEGDKSLAESLYFYQNAEGTGLAPFDCWLVSRGMKTMALRVERQQINALLIAKWLQTLPCITKVLYAGLPDHPDYDIQMSQASGGGSVVCFVTGNVELSRHIVTTTKLFKITVSFGSVTSLISLPGLMSHASIPADVKSAREFPEDLVRMSIGIESPDDLIADLYKAIQTFGK